MAKSPVNLTARINRLEAAEKRAAKVKKGTIYSFKPMAELLGVTRPTLIEWCDSIEGFERSGCFNRGGNGIEWEFKPRETVKFLLDHFRRTAAAQAEKSRALTKSVGVTLASDDSALSLAEVKDRLNLTLAVVQAAERQRHYMLAEDVDRFLSAYNQTVVDGIMGVRTKVDPNGNLPPAVRKLVDEHLRSLAVSVHGLAKQFIEEHRASSQQAGVGGAGTTAVEPSILPTR